MKRYTKFATLHSTQLTRDDVVKLFEIIRGDNMPTMQEEHIEISTQVEDMRISSDSIAEFISHPELPDRLNDLAYELMIWNEEGKMKKFVFFSLNKDGVYLRVDGNEPIWVNGKFTQVADFLAMKRAWYAPLKSTFSSLKLFVPVLTLVALWNFMQEQKALQTFSTALFFVFFLADVYYYRKGILFPTVDIDLQGRSKIFDGQTMLVLMTLVTLTLTLLASLMRM